jgi:hypothetical protein
MHPIEAVPTLYEEQPAGTNSAVICHVYSYINSSENRSNMA